LGGFSRLIYFLVKGNNEPNLFIPFQQEDEEPFGYIFKQIFVILMLVDVIRNVSIRNEFVTFVELACIFSTLMMLVTIYTR